MKFGIVIPHSALQEEEKKHIFVVILSEQIFCILMLCLH